MEGCQAPEGGPLQYLLTIQTNQKHTDYET